MLKPASSSALVSSKGTNSEPGSGFERAGGELQAQVVVLGVAADLEERRGAGVRAVGLGVEELDLGALGADAHRPVARQQPAQAGAQHRLVTVEPLEQDGIERVAAEGAAEGERLGSGERPDAL